MPRENLLTPSTIKLFGRVMKDLHFKYDPQTLVSGYNNFLQHQLANGPGPVHLTITATTMAGQSGPPAISAVVSDVSSMTGLFQGMIVNAQVGGKEVFGHDTVISRIGPRNTFAVSPVPLIIVKKHKITVTYDGSPNFARIYAFSFEGAYCALPRPSIFLVHGIGTPLGNWDNPSTLEQSGVMGREWDFSDQTNPVTNPDLMYWEYERGDFSIRLDSEAGPFEQILLAAALRAGADMADRSGASLGVRSGASLSGASLSGASLSGASLSGASLSGASLAGASLRNGR